MASVTVSPVAPSHGSVHSPSSQASEARDGRTGVLQIELDAEIALGGLNRLVAQAELDLLKYRPEFPGRFGSIEDGRAFCQRFFRWYNDEHRHSGIGFHTPADVHFGRVVQAQIERIRVLREVYAAHPERFVRQPPVPPALPAPA